MNKQILAHRGARGLVKYENTIDAFEKAVEVGSTGVEIDIRKTKDNIIVVHHDEDIKGNIISSLTFNELITISKENGFIVPTLEETILYCKNKCYMDIEFKESGYEEEALNLIKQYLDYSEFCIRSFIDEVIINVKLLDNNVRCGLLLGTGHPKKPIWKTRLSEIFPKKRIKKCNCDFVAPYYKILIFGFLKRMKKMNIPVSVWILNSKDRLHRPSDEWAISESKIIKKMINNKGVYSIVTDYPNVAIEILNSKK